MECEGALLSEGESVLASLHLLKSWVKSSRLCVIVSGSALPAQVSQNTEVKQINTRLGPGTMRKLSLLCGHDLHHHGDLYNASVLSAK